MRQDIQNLVDNDSSCGWIEQLEQSALRSDSTAPLKGAHKVDWLIVGAGFTGLAFARRMAQARPGDRIVLVDAGAPGAGASSRNSGFAVATSSMWQRYDRAKLAEFKRINRINAAGIDSLREIVQAHDIACDWGDVGKYHCTAQARGAREAAQFTDWLEAGEVEHRVLGEDELRAELGTSHYQRGVWTARDVMLQPAALVSGLLQTLPQNVECYGFSPVTDWQREGKRIAIKTPDASISAANLVLASNAFLHTMTARPSYTVPLTLTASLSRVLTPAERQTLAVPRQWGVLSLHNSGATVRYTADHRILIRNTFDYIPSAVLGGAQMAEAKALHAQSLRARFPALSELSFEYTWQGVLCASRNASSLFGELERGVYAAGCYNASGVARGSALGYLLADYALKQDSPLLGDALAYAKPNWLPPRPLLDLVMRTEVARRKCTVGAEL